MSAVQQDQLFSGTTSSAAMEYARVFRRRNIIGGLKGYSSPFPGQADWIVRARFLLCKMEGIIYEELLHPVLDEPECAAWIAGLLKEKKYFEFTAQKAVEGGNQFFSCAYFAALLLYEDVRAAGYLHEHLRANTNGDLVDYTNAKPLAVHALRLLDKKYGTTHALPYADITVPRRAEKLLDTILHYSVILRAGIVFSHPAELQLQLENFLEKTVTPLQYLDGLIHLPSANRRSLAGYAEQFEQFAEKIRAQYADYKNGKTNALPDTDAGPWLDRKMLEKHAANSWQLTSAAIAFLSSPLKKSLYAELQQAARQSESAADLLSAVECDLYHQLPAEIIDLCFEKLAGLLNPSLHLFQQHAIQLLLRGTSHDEKAKTLYAKYEALSRDVEWMEKSNSRYAMRRKPE